LRLDIKWPNDIVVDRRKIGGILAEAVTSAGASRTISSVVLGYGVNVGPMSYPRLVEMFANERVEPGADRARCGRPTP
jgi:BirA family biotin operon repressor/biotin-[acetyl-CoA-carboxylase] ligase